MFDLLLANLRAREVRVGLGEWMVFLEGLESGLVNNLDDLYSFGRAVLCKDQTQFDAWDLAYTATFEGVALEPELSEALLAWLEEAKASEGEWAHISASDEELLQQLRERLAEQKERHDGGSRWVGTGGTSPFGHSGRADKGVRVGGKGGNRSAIRVAGERRWANYRTDTALQTRDFKVALRALRHLAREGAWELDLDQTIRRTADNAGDIDLAWQRERKNRVHLRLVMDTGGSMEPHTRLVERLFTAASETRGFKSFQALYFHNAPYGHLYTDYDKYERTPIPELLREWTHETRVLFVGDASMAPYELFTPMNAAGWGTSRRGQVAMCGLDWLKAIRRRCPVVAWLNPDPVRWWQHPTVDAIGGVIPMYPLTVRGMRDAVSALRAGSGVGKASA